MAASRSRRNTHASRALARRRPEAGVETDARRRLGAEPARTRPVDPGPAAVPAARVPDPPATLHTVVVKVPAGERRGFSDAVRAVLVLGATAHEAAASTAGGTGPHALGSRPGRIVPLAVLPGRVPVLDARSVLGAEIDAERWVFCPRCATRARFRGRTERLPSPGGVWVGDPGATDVVIVPCRLCSPKR